MKNNVTKTSNNFTRKGPSCYGKLYWCIKSNISEDGEIYVWANEIRVENGALKCIGYYGCKEEDFSPESIAEETGKNNLVIAAGKWQSFYWASLIDGSAMAVERWKGEIEIYRDENDYIAT